MPTRDSWSNPDGLIQYFGPRYTENNIAQTSHPANGEKVLQVYVRGEDIPASVADAATLAADPRAAYIPAGAYLVSAVFLVDEAFDSAGDAATLDIGLTSLAGVVTDMNGIDAAVAEAALAAGADIASDGALIGTKMAGNVRVVFGYGTEAFTSGSGRLVLKFVEPPVQSS